MSEKELEKLIGETANLIDAMLEVVLPDFERITRVLKSIEFSSENQTLTKAYSAVVQELQYYDTLTQKMEHIKTIHHFILQSLLSDSSNQLKGDVSGLSLIRLNHIQFQVGCFEYLSSVNEIESNLKILVEGTGSKAAYVFEYSNLLLSASRFINKNFTMLEQALAAVREADLQNKVEHVNAIYSMESERTILQAYLNKPLLNDCELEPLHKSSRQTEIDLFE